jgi:hypothetical protein
MEVAMNSIGYPQDAAAHTVKSQARPAVIDSAAWPASTGRSPLVAAVSAPDFVAIAIFCAIGLLATLNLVLNISGIGLLM